MKKKITVLTLSRHALCALRPPPTEHPMKVPRIGLSIGGKIQLLSPPVPREFGGLCASLTT